jgi:probable ATP-dependent RNA helicase DDX4
MKSRGAAEAGQPAGAQRNRQQSACYRCGGEGHISKDCPGQASGPHADRRNGRPAAMGPGENGCYNCGESGHFARECRGEGRRRREEGVREGGRGGEGERRDNYVPEESLEENLYEHGVGSGINFRSYENIPVKVTGMNSPEKIDSFGMMGLDERVMSNIIRSKYREPTPVQKHAIPMILAGRDVMGCAQTGSGKTGAFLIPIIQRLLQAGVGSRGRGRQASPEVVIMSPTRELAIQIKDEARKFCNGSDIRCMVVYGGTSTSYQAGQLEEGCNILVATPGRLHDYVERGRVSYSPVQYLVLDEADRMLDMGFKDDIIKMVRNPAMPGKGSRRTMMFSATFPDEIQKMAFEFLADDYLFLGVGRVGGACKDVEQKFEQVEQYDKREKLLNIIRESKSNNNGNTRKTLVFVETKKTADFLASYMCQSEVAATSIHGDRLQREREEALRYFKKGEKPVLVATAVAARGLDIKGVEHVVNYDLPSDIDEYVHRIGRTGRVGNTGQATSFYDRGKDGGLASALLVILAEAQQVAAVLPLSPLSRSSPTGWRPRRGGTRRVTTARAAASASAAATSAPRGLASPRPASRWSGTRAGTRRGAFARFVSSLYSVGWVPP